MNEWIKSELSPLSFYSTNVVTTNVCLNFMLWNQSFLNLCTPTTTIQCCYYISCHYNDHITTMYEIGIKYMYSEESKRVILLSELASERASTDEEELFGWERIFYIYRLHKWMREKKGRVFIEKIHFFSYSVKFSTKKAQLIDNWNVFLLCSSSSFSLLLNSQKKTLSWRAKLLNFS